MALWINYLRGIEAKLDCKREEIINLVLSGQAPGIETGGFLRGIPRGNERV